MATFAERAAAGQARGGGVQAQLQMGRDKIQQAQFAQRQEAAQRAQQYQAQQDMARMALDRDKMEAQQAQFEAGQGLERERMAGVQSRFDQGFGITQAQEGRADQQFQLEQMERQRELAAQGAMAGFAGAEGASGYWDTPEAQYIEQQRAMGNIDDATAGLVHQDNQATWMEMNPPPKAGSGGAFAGTGFDQQAANVIYNQEMAQHGDHNLAMQNAIDRVRGGRVRTYKDPVTGQQVVETAPPLFTGGGLPVLDGSTGQPVPAQVPATVPQQLPPSADLYSRGPEATGPVAAGAEILGNLWGMVPGVDTDLGTDVTQIKSEMNVHKQALLAGLANNPRYPQGERDAISEALDVDAKAFKSGEKLQAAMRGTDKALRDRLSVAERIATDATQPPDAQRAAKQMVTNLNTYLRNLNVPQEGGLEGIPDDIMSILDLYPGQ